MNSTVLDFDAVVIGAGTAGSNAAFQLAERGLTVALIERRTIGEAGAQWHNSVLDWQFERAGLDPSTAPERSDRVSRFHMFGPDGSHAFSMADPPTVPANMSLLGDRLRNLALDRGVAMFDQVSELEPRLDGNRIVSIACRASPAELTPTGPPGLSATTGTLRFDAPLFVDASGRHGALRRHSPLLQQWCSTVRGDELCSASDFLFRVADRTAALRFLDRHRALPGESISRVGTAGGFSTIGVTVSQDVQQVSVLVGCLANGRYGTGPRMLDQLRRDQPWIGEPLMGGSGVIPLRRPYSRFTAPGLALVGDSACQVFPAHGSGIGIGLIAGSMLAEAVTTDRQGPSADPGDEQALWHYQSQFQREFGGSLAAYDGLRRLTTALGSAGVSTMLAIGLVNETMTRSGLDQVWSVPPAVDTATSALRLAQNPRLAGHVLPRLVRSQLAGRLALRHPKSVDPAGLRRWDNQLVRVLGAPPS